LEEDRRRRRKQRHTAKRVYDRLAAEKQFAGSYWYSSWWLTHHRQGTDPPGVKRTDPGDRHRTDPPLRHRTDPLGV